MGVAGGGAGGHELQKRSRDRRSVAEKSTGETLAAEGAAVRRKRRKSEWRLGAAGVPYRVYVRGKEVFGQQEIRLGVKKSSGVRVEEQRR